MTGREEKKQHIFCPYCDMEVTKAELPYCQACGVTIFYCPSCRKPLPRENRVCPHCGTGIQGEVAEGR